MDVAQDSCGFHASLWSGRSKDCIPSRCSLEKWKRIRLVVIVSPKQEVLTSTASHLWARRRLSLFLLVLACSSLTHPPHPPSTLLHQNYDLGFHWSVNAWTLLWGGLNYYCSATRGSVMLDLRILVPLFFLTWHSPPISNLKLAALCLLPKERWPQAEHWEVPLDKVETWSHSFWASSARASWQKWSNSFLCRILNWSIS